MLSRILKRLRIIRVKSDTHCSLPGVKQPFVDRESEISNAICPICLEIVGSPDSDGRIESWTLLHFGHFFGSACIQTWLQGSFDQDERKNMGPSCPICRSPAKHPVCGHLLYTGPSFEKYLFAWEQYHITTITEARSLGTYLGSFQRHVGARRQTPYQQSSLTVTKRVVDTIGKCQTWKLTFAPHQWVPIACIGDSCT